MARPHLTFFCELEAGPLQELFARQDVVNDLVDLQANVSLALLDLSTERAAVVRHLNETGIPVTAWQLLPKEQGYWFNASNVHQAATRYGEFKTWTAEHGLRWAAIGVDIEPDMREAELLGAEKRRLVHTLLPRAFDYERMRRAQSDYNLLLAQMRIDGYIVESYVSPVILDERKAGSTLLRRISGLVDVSVDREVPMLYSSFLRPRGAGTLWSYAPDVQAIAVGSTGGGVSVAGADQIRPLGWDELTRDLRLARRWVNDVYIFSLEGCVRQGFLAPLKNFDWDRPFTPPLDVAAQVNQFRGVVGTGLWMSAHPFTMLSSLLVVGWLLSKLRRLMKGSAR